MQTEPPADKPLTDMGVLDTALERFGRDEVARLTGVKLSTVEKTWRHRQKLPEKARLILEGHLGVRPAKSNVIQFRRRTDRGPVGDAVRMVIEIFETGHEPYKRAVLKILRAFREEFQPQKRKRHK